MIDYDPRGWKNHLFDIHGSMAHQILSRVLSCAVFSAVVVGVHTFIRRIEIPLTAHNLIGLALGLLLVFRTNASYDRYWEGRRLWGGIINECRNLARGARTYLGESQDLRTAITVWTQAFPYATMHSLRGSSSLGPIADRLPAGEAESVLAAQHVPLAVASRISETLGEARSLGLISDYVRVELDRSVHQLVDFLGGCERIRRTPLPFVYVAHLRRALTLYCFTLPLALVGAYGWYTLVVVPLLAYILFGIEEIGVEIENPFGKDVNDLPLERFCETVDQNLAEIASLAPPSATSGGSMASFPDMTIT
jgi:putative membrane protein